MQTFQDKICIVTGGASGIGAAMCRQLAAAGARVVVADINEEGAKSLASSIGAEHARLDVTDEAAVKALVDDTVARRGRIDYLFNNAGIGCATEIRDSTLSQWKRVLDINLYGVIHGVLAAYPIMVRQGSGHIVNTASGYGLTPGPGVAPYIASKFAVVGLSEALRIEAADLGVSVSTVCPGFIETAILEQRPDDRIDTKRFFARLPTKPITAEDAAQRALAGVARREAIIAFPGYVKVLTGLYRFAPRIFSLLQKRTVKQIRALRLTPG
jgi:NAD(P)-dependent dehydrogenase (short-subunit alcohol dehydrogenase family)